MGAAAPFLVMGGLQLAGGLYGAAAARRAGRDKQAYYNFLAGQDDQQATLTRQRGAQQITSIQDEASLAYKNYRRSAAQVRGSQVANLAANGVGSSATAEDIDRDTRNVENIDEAAIRFNADSQSYTTSLAAEDRATALVNEGKSYRMAGENARRAGNIDAIGGLLGTATNVASSYYSYGGANRTPSFATVKGRGTVRVAPPNYYKSRTY